jgi:quinolinate synthase
LLPDAGAGCPMANMITAAQLRELKKEHPDATVVTYVNSSAAVKAESDYCCTSANGVKVVQSIKNNEIIFVPDQYLGDFIAKRTGKNMIFWPGYCPTHVKLLPEDIIKSKQEHPGAKIVVHPECRPDVIALADEALSTSGMIRYAAREDVKELIVGTEIELLHRLHKENPGKKFYAASRKAVCPNMKKITLEKILESLETMQPEVKVPEDIRVKAKLAVDRMLELV